MAELPLKPCKILGSTGLVVSPIGLGTMTFGTNWKSWTGDQTKEDSEKVFSEYLSLGGNFIDTSNNYQFGQSEEWLGEWIEKRGNRDDLVLATKYASIQSPEDKNAVCLRGDNRKALVVNLRESLKRLRTTYIDILYVHYWDFSVDPETLMKNLNAVVESGQVLHIGISDCPAWIVSRANTIAEARGWAKFEVYQGKWSLADRSMERDIIPMCVDMGITIIPWGVLGQGKLTGRYKKGEETGKRAMWVNMSEQDYQVQDVVLEVAAETGHSAAEVAIAWALCKVDNCIALLGCRTVTHLTSAIGGVTLKLNDEQLLRLDQVSEDKSMGFPHDFIGHSYETCPWVKNDVLKTVAGE